MLIRKFAIGLIMVTGLVGCNGKEEVDSDKTEEVEEVSTETTATTTDIEDSIDNMDVMTEDEIMAITGHEWITFNNEEKFDAVSNIMYLLSEQKGYTFSLTEMDYVNFLDDSYAKAEHLDKQFASLFIFIYALEEEN